MLRGQCLLLSLVLALLLCLSESRGGAVEVGAINNHNYNINNNNHVVGGEDGRRPAPPASGRTVSHLNTGTSAFFKPPRVVLGNEQLRRNDFEILRGMRVAVLSNPTGVFADSLEHIVDSMAASSGVKLQAIFSPEHGFR